jgi:cytochrome c biogenesis protein CcmG, thiol:disulfide interchange protein DsbE
MKHRHAFRFFHVALALMPALLGLLPAPTRAQLPVIRFVRDPDPAPAFKTKDLDGKDLSLEAYRGKVVLLNFWATWCGPCRAEIPSLIELQNQYKDRLQILAMTVDVDDENDVRTVVKDEGINYRVAIASPEVRMAYGGIAALPTLFVINAEGKVVQKHVGLYNPALYETEARALLDLPINARVETFEDTGEVFLKHADRATSLPGIDMSSLTPEQREVVLRKMNAETCDCGCKFTLAQCRIWDRKCSVSQARATAIIKEVAGGEKVKSEKPAATPTAPAIGDPAAAPPAAPNDGAASAPPAQPAQPPKP